MKRWLALGAFLILWTIALETPVSEADELPGGTFIMTNRVLVAKCVHITMYALLAILAGIVPLASRYRAVLMFFVMGHACATELIQEELRPHFHRGGSLYDVGLDELGITIGMILSWKGWTRPDPERTTAEPFISSPMRQDKAVT